MFKPTERETLKMKCVLHKTFFTSGSPFLCAHVT